jgi:ProP effector
MSKDALRRREIAAETLARLTARFPLTFALEGPRQPLKIGIDRDISTAVTDMSPRAVKDALRFYVGSLRYQRALVDGAERIDLAGAPAGIVSTDVAAKAKASIGLILEHKKQASLAMKEQQNATKLRNTVPKVSPATETALAADKPPIIGAPAPSTSSRPKLSLQGLREAAQRRKAESKR